MMEGRDSPQICLSTRSWQHRLAPASWRLSANRQQNRSVTTTFSLDKQLETVTTEQQTWCLRPSLKSVQDGLKQIRPIVIKFMELFA